MVDGSWTSTAQFSGCGWDWRDGFKKNQLMGMWNLRRREIALHSEVKALQWKMESMLQHSSCQSFGTDYKDLIAMINEPHAWPSFAIELEAIKTLQIVSRTSRYLISLECKFVSNQEHRLKIHICRHWLFSLLEHDLFVGIFSGDFSLTSSIRQCSPSLVP